MQTSVTIKTIYNCSLERAFKTPILCDVTKVHTGFWGVMPKVINTVGNTDWGKPGSSKKIMVAKSLTYKEGEAFTDKVIERKENQYWIIELSGFTTFMFGFTKFVGKWATTELAPNKILIEYTYVLHSQIPWLYPLNWLFTKIFWRLYMKQVLNNIRKLSYNNEPYQYD